MIIAECQAWIKHELQSLYEAREAANITDIILEHFTGLKRIDRLLKGNQPLSELETEKIQAAVQKLLQHMPMQYVLGQAWFYGLPFFVNESVLIPRPETEELVDWIVTDVNDTHQPLNILDIGTGSGCIPVSLKSKLPRANVYAIDISVDALAVAQKNAADLGTDVHFILHDILNHTQPLQIPAPDIIVSNPPYIPLADKKQMQKNVLDYEPHLALFVTDENPLLFYEAIAVFAQQQLNASGYVYSELHEEMAEKAKTLFSEKGFINIVVKQDLQGKERMLKAQKPA